MGSGNRLTPKMPKTYARGDLPHLSIFVAPVSPTYDEADSLLYSPGARSSTLDALGSEAVPSPYLSERAVITIRRRY